VGRHPGQRMAHLSCAGINDPGANYGKRCGDRVNHRGYEYTTVIQHNGYSYSSHRPSWPSLLSADFAQLATHHGNDSIHLIYLQRKILKGHKGGEERNSGREELVNSVQESNLEFRCLWPLYIIHSHYRFLFHNCHSVGHSPRASWLQGTQTILHIFHDIDYYYCMYLPYF